MPQLPKRSHALTPALRAAVGAALACALSAPHAAAELNLSLAFALQAPPVSDTAAPAPAAPAPGDEDTDGDGIPDNEDACKRVKGVASDTPRLNGCPPPPPPLDSDGDGVADTDDACPKKKGVASDDPKLNGCPARAVKAPAAPTPPPPTPPPGNDAAGGPAELTFAGFRSFDDGTSLVFVELTGPITVDVKKVPGALVYTLEHTKVPLRNNRNPLVTGDFPSILRGATVAQRKHAVELTIELRADITPEHRLVQRSGTTVLEIQLPKAPPAPPQSAAPALVAPVSPRAQQKSHHRHGH